MAQARSYDLIVIGSGAAGGVAAQLVAQTGRKVALVESDMPGGHAPNYADIPSKALLTAANAYQSAQQARRYGIRIASAAYNFPSIRAWKEKVIEATGVRDANEAYAHEHIEYISGRAHFIDKQTITVHDHLLTADKFLIATGATDNIPDIAGLIDAGFLTSKQALDLKSPPKSLAIIGGGATGVEMAELFNSFGTKVTLIEKKLDILPKEDFAISDLLQRVFIGRGIDVITSANVFNIEVAQRKKKTLSIEIDEEISTLDVDEILIATGRKPVTNLGLEEAKVRHNTNGIIINAQLQTSNKRIYAAGDVTGLGHYTHVSTTQGRVVANNMFSSKSVAVDYSVIPRATYTWPEVASVGATEQKLRADRRPYRAVNVPIAVTARSIITGDDVGFVKIMARPDGRILGAAIIAPRASDMLAELTLAMQYKLTVQQIANTAHPFPSWSDAVRVACSQF